MGCAYVDPYSCKPFPRPPSLADYFVYYSFICIIITKDNPPFLSLESGL